MTPLRLVVVVAVLAAAGAAVAIVDEHHSHTTAGPPAVTTTTPASGTGSTSSSAAATDLSLHVTALSPADGAAAVSGLADLRVSFSAAIASTSPPPSLSPPQPGTWSRATSDSFVFVPAMAYLPLSAIKLVVPAGAQGVRGADGGLLARPVTDTFRIADGSTTRLVQLLALLDYSPVAFSATGAAVASSDETAQRAALFEPPAGLYRWRNRGWPKQLTALWNAHSYGVFTKGLVMEFQADHGLPANGATSTALWQSLLGALATGQHNTGGYDYALGNQAQPETLTIWHNGTVVVHVPANTGIAQAPTADGNFPVFARFRRQIMRGTNPDGSKYADPVQYVAYFNGGDAVHYFPRASYGIPQSLGCIELNLSDAAKAWPYLAYGTLVSVIN